MSVEEFHHFLVTEQKVGFFTVISHVLVVNYAVDCLNFMLI